MLVARQIEDEIRCTNISRRGELVSRGIIVGKLSFVIFHTGRVCSTRPKKSIVVLFLFSYVFHFRGIVRLIIVPGNAPGRRPAGPGISYESRYEKLGIFRTSEHF